MDNNHKILAKYQKISHYIQKGVIGINKIRGQDPQSGTLIERPYIEIILFKSQKASTFMELFVKKYIVILRDYSTKTIIDNLSSLKSAALKKDDYIPNSIHDPFNILFFKPYGQYGLGISFDVSPENIKLHQELSFYDTKDLRDLDTEEFKDHASIMIFSKSIKHTIYTILDDLEKVL